MASRSSARAQVRMKSNTPAFCPHHPGNKAIFVCTRQGCGEGFTCTKCVTSNHKGHEMEDLSVFANSKRQVLKQKVKIGKDNILPSLLQKIKFTDDKITENKLVTKAELDRLLQRLNEMKEKLDNIYKKYSNLCKKTGEISDRKLAKHKECLESVYNKYKTELEEYEEIIEEGSDSEVVLAERAEFPTSLIGPNHPETDVIQFKCKGISITQLEELFGDMKTVTKTGMVGLAKHCESVVSSKSSQIIQIISQFVIQGEINRCYLHPFLDEICVWIYQSETVSFVNKKGIIRKTVSLSSKLKLDIGTLQLICVSPADNTLWLMSNSGNVWQLRPDGSQVQNFNISANSSYYYSMCISRRQLLVVGVSHGNTVLLITTSGKVTGIIDTKDICLNDCAFVIVQCQKTGRFAISDFIGISVTDEDLRHLFTIHGETITLANGITSATGYKPEKRFDPYNLCFDVDGDLLIVDRNNFNVVMFSDIGQYIRTVIQETENDNKPCNINTSSDGSLWVAHFNGVFKQIKYKP